MNAIDLILILVGVLFLWFFLPWFFKQCAKLLKYFPFLGDKYRRGGQRYE
jgi:flagellar biosynthesis protein FlhB